jgi:segregation and condensation protein B
MRKVNSELKNIVEAALLVAGLPVTLEKLQTLFPDAASRPTREEIREVIDALNAEYATRGIEIQKIDKSYRIQTRDKYSPWIQRLVEERPARYSRALLETLAIIAYRQPVTRADVEEIRGVSVSTEIIKTLMGREWIREVGRREVPGRPVLYGTTKEFLEHFNLKSLTDLPPLSELRPIEQISAELERQAAAAAESGVADDAEASETPTRTAQQTEEAADGPSLARGPRLGPIGEAALQAKPAASE